MKSLFGAHDALELVENGYEDLGANPTDAHRVTFKELKRKDCKALQVEEEEVEEEEEICVAK
ncbi:hypothetical protein MTR_7g056303 [Medicago truncatula]|uniref:Uncharacterized protein n=1 Tax=Medicago truncatula TaxID=3880 RepID=A0A072TYY3_MEDTR|nr:hypothetical protein MTR_7g056303 [Medicago truncatula]